MDVHVRDKEEWLKKLSNLSKTKLEHLCQLKEDQIKTYISATKNTPVNRKIYVEAYLDRLNIELREIKSFIVN